MEPRSYRRRTVLIDREFQLKFIYRMAGILFFYLLVFLMVSVVAPVGLTLLGDNREEAMMEVAFRVEVLLNLVLVPMVCTFLCLFVHGILETFRIAGPNFRFKMVFRDLVKGRIPRGVSIRNADYHQDTADLLDRALITVHDRLREAQRKSSDLMAMVQDGDPGAADAAKELVTHFEQFEFVTQAPACRPIDADAEEEAVESQEPQSTDVEAEVRPEPVATSSER